jgi:hypothetical protein
LNSFDSLKLTSDVDALKDYKTACFDLNTKQSRDKKITWLTSNRQDLGIKSIKIFDGAIEIETSAKILKDQYLSGINENTFERYVDEINRSGLIVLDLQKFYEIAKVQKIDVTKNIYPSDIGKTITDLSIYSAEKKYSVEPYKTGIEVHAKAKSNNERFILYDKQKELSRNIKPNRELLQYFPVETSKGILRAETNFRHYRDMRNAFHISKNSILYFKELLQSDVNVLSETFDRLYNIENINISQTIEGKKNLMITLHENRKTLNQVDKEFSMRERIVFCNYNLDLIMRMIRPNVKGNLSPYKKQYRDLIKVMQYETLEKNLNSITEIKDLLKVA